MTLLEALIALGIAGSIIVAGMQVSRLAAERAAIATLDIEAAAIAANVLAAVDVNNATNNEHLHGRDDDKGATWTVDILPNEPEFGTAAVDVTATVQIARGALVAEKTISNLKLRSGVR
jgi:hypothetical protein